MEHPTKGIGLFRSIVTCQCPSCRRANLFSDTRHYHLTTLFDMPDRCPNCGQDFIIEPGFYLGALWVSYPIVIALELIFIAISLFVFKQTLTVSFIVASLLLLLLSPVLIRVSRSLFIHINVGFKR